MLLRDFHHNSESCFGYHGLYYNGAELGFDKNLQKAFDRD